MRPRHQPHPRRHSSAAAVGAAKRRTACLKHHNKMAGSNMWEMERRYSVAENDSRGLGLPPPSLGMVPSTSEDLHAWSIYRQNLNSDFTDSALGSSEKSPLPYGNFQLRESTVQSILNHPRYGPKTALGSNMYTYLKFGLPRVFPPKGGAKETSSGYNSSDEGCGGGGRPPRSGGLRGHHHLGHHPGAYMRAAQSEADILNLHYQPGITARGKSISQANLLSLDTLMRQASASHRRSLHDLRHTDYMHHNLIQPPLTRPASVAMVSPHHGAPGSVISGAGGLPPLHPAAEHFSFSTLHPQQYTGLYPHLQVRNLNVRTKKGEQLVNNLSMEVKAGEILSIMSTNGCVATSLLEVIAGRGQYSGHISLNGQAVSSSDLRRISAYARADSVLHPDLAVHNCLCFYSKLRRPNKSRGKMPIEEQVRMVTEELGLSPVLDTKISELTKSEYSRLLVAIQLLTDPQVLCIGHITHTMDIFDTFFLVEFLRQWASGATGGVTGRIVVMSLQPPTYEILTMVSRLVMLSGGETMYHGPARHLAQYFTSVEYPCPAYKNPSDYYLDLVTLDDLSAEAMLESSQRVDQLASLYRRRQQPLSETQPYALPTKFMLAGPLAQMFALVMKEAVYSQPSSFFKWVSRVLLSALMSVIMGAIFWDIPASDPQLYREDRLGYHYSMMVVAAWPLMMVLGFSRTHGVNRRAAESDLRQNLYNRTLYIVCSLVFTLVPSALIWLAYLLPAYCMTGLYDQSTADGLTFYLGYGVVHLLSLQLWTAAVGEVVPGGRCSAGVVAGLVCAAMGASSGYPLHRADAPAPLVIAAAATPLPWLYTPLVAREMSQDTLTHLNQHLVCRNKQVQHQDIIVQLPCPVANGTLALLHHGFPVESDGQRSQYSSLFDSPPTGSPVVPPLVVLTVAALVTVVAFTLSPLVTMYGRQRR